MVPANDLETDHFRGKLARRIDRGHGASRARAKQHKSTVQEAAHEKDDAMDSAHTSSDIWEWGMLCAKH